MTDMTELFTREGVSQKPQGLNAKDQPVYFITSKTCNRCGGVGRAEKWRYTGLTCYDCGGRGKLACQITVRLYTADELERLNTVQAKRDATRAAKNEAARQVEMDRRNAERNALMQKYMPLFSRMAKAGIRLENDTRETFFGSIYFQVSEHVRPLSDKQRTAVITSLEKIEAERARKASAQYVGIVGERRDFTLTYVRSIQLQDYGFGVQYITVARDQDGNTIMYKGPYAGLFPCVYNRELNQHDIPDGATVTVKATVKEHKEYKGEPQTIINRPKVLTP